MARHETGHVVDMFREIGRGRVCGIASSRSQAEGNSRRWRYRTSTWQIIHLTGRLATTTRLDILHPSHTESRHWPLFRDNMVSPW